MKQCKCEHWQQCPACMPHRFDAEGNLKPPEPTPLQACQSQVSALTRALFQAQKAAKNLAKHEWVGLTNDEISECWGTGNVVAAVEAKLKEKNHG